MPFLYLVELLSHVLQSSQVYEVYYIINLKLNPLSWPLPSKIHFESMSGIPERPVIAVCT